MNFQLPRVTIAVPTLNRLDLLRIALASALSQTYSNLQVIVGDNASTDGTAEFVSSLDDLRLLSLRHDTNLGMVGNWNACLDRAEGEFFLLLSDDDYLEPLAIEKLVTAILEAPDANRIGVAYCRTREVDRDGHPQRIDPIPPPYENAKDFAIEYFRGRRKMHPCSTLLRTDDLRAIGGYQQGEVVLAIDAMVWSRILLRRGMIAAVPNTLSNYRIHPGSETSSQKINIWRSDIAALTGLWAAAFDDAEPSLRREFQRAAAHYRSWELAAIINQSAKSLGATVRSIRLYCECREEFGGLVGFKNLAGGLMKLFTPEFFKRPIRKILVASAR
ncbi:MAG: glycosyltransferase family 2 protein [Acidobacteriaceae bacterium]